MSGLSERIRARAALVPLPAAEVMALALYDPVDGYYRRTEGPWGFAGKDYYTALDLGPLLGEALARRFEAVWEGMGRPATFTVLEAGAGRGWLGRDLLEGARAPFREALRYLHRDDNPAGRAAAEEALAPWLPSGRARFLTETEVLPEVRGAVLSNELFDALPAQPWRWDGSAWSFEALGPGGGCWVPGEPCEATAWFEAQAEGGLEAGDGSVWCEGLPSVVRDLAGCLQEGLFLTLDYGETGARLLDKGAGLRRFKGHRVDGSWWEDPGEADLTADVDFTRLGRLLAGEGLAEIRHVSLSQWIRSNAPLAEWEAGWLELEPALQMRRMENLLQLTLPDRMGERFRVLEALRPRS